MTTSYLKQALETPANSYIHVNSGPSLIARVNPGPPRFILLNSGPPLTTLVNSGLPRFILVKSGPSRIHRLSHITVRSLYLNLGTVKALGAFPAGGESYNSLTMSKFHT